jgi:hypothetical protein
MNAGSRSALFASSLAIALTAYIAAPITDSLVMARETAVALEKNPPGDIPDDQVFVQYTSPLGFRLKIPEGWARLERPGGVRFFDKYNIIDVSVAKAEQAPSAATVGMGPASELQVAGRGAEIKAIKEVKLRSGPAVLISYISNSDPNPVTSKQIQLEHDRYLIFKDSTLVSLDMSAPLGADNVDQWKLMSNSFQWQ